MKRKKKQTKKHQLIVTTTEDVEAGYKNLSDLCRQHNLSYPKVYRYLSTGRVFEGDGIKVKRIKIN